MMEAFWKILIVFILITSVWGVVLGLRREAIFFNDAEDLWLSFAGWIALAVLIIFGLLLDWRWLGYVGFAVAAYFAYQTIRRAFDHNGGDVRLALPVGIGKVLFSFVYIFMWIEALQPGGKTIAQRQENRVFAFVVIGLLTALFAKLINGEEVLAQRGAMLPIEK